MTDKPDVRLHLAFLAAYSLFFCFLAFPYWVASRMGGAFAASDLLFIGAIAVVPSVVYFMLAWKVLSSGVLGAWLVHLIYGLTCVPVTGGWLYVVLWISLATGAH